MTGGPLREWLATADATSTWTASVCTGALILAGADRAGGLGGIAPAEAPSVFLPLGPRHAGSGVNASAGHERGREGVHQGGGALGAVLPVGVHPLEASRVRESGDAAGRLVTR
jgi:putative intracellular protease/amidase